MALSRPVYTKIWSDKMFRNLSHIEQKLLLYLQTNEKFEQLAIYEIPIDYIAFETRIPLEEVEEIMRKFEDELGLIKYSNDTEEIALLYYNEYGIISSQNKGTSFENTFTNIERKVKDKSLLLDLYNSSLKYADKNKGNDKFTFAINKIKECLIGWEYDLQQTETILKTETGSPTKEDNPKTNNINTKVKEMYELIAKLENRLRERNFSDIQFEEARQYHMSVSKTEDCSDIDRLQEYEKHLLDFI